MGALKTTAVAIFIAAAFVVFTPRANADDFQEELLGVTAAGEEIGTLLVLKRGERFWLPLNEVTAFADLKVLSDEKGAPIQIATPLGPTEIGSQHVFRRNQVRYIDQQYFETRLNTAISFDEENYAISFDTPWKKGSPPREIINADGEAELVPDVVPPAYGVSTIHGDISYETGRNLHDYGRANGDFKLTGHAYGGLWQLRYHDDIYDNHRIHEAVWMKELSPHRSVQIGHQRVGLHPLLDAVEITGAQYAWNSQPNISANETFHPGSLIGRRGRHHKSYSGTGPVGGFAELWLEGRRVARQSIGFDGNYTFDDVALPSRRTDVEIRVFDRRNPRVPVETVHETLNLSDLLLDEGQTTIVTAVGLEENVFDRFGRRRATNFNDDATAAAIIYARHGIWERVTLEAGVTRQDDETTGLIGTVVRLGDNAIVTVAGAAGDQGSLSYNAELDWERDRYRIYARSYWDQEARDHDVTVLRGGVFTRDDDDIEDYEHAVEASAQVTNTLRIGLRGQIADEEDYVLPFAEWRPVPGLSVRARPDRFGLYTVNAQYRISDRDHISGSLYEDYLSVDYTRRLNADMSLVAGVDTDFRDGFNDPRYSLGLIGSKLFGRDVSWRAAATYNGDQLGFDGSLRTELRPGVIGYIEATHDHYGSLLDYERRERDDLRLRAGITFDFAASENGFIASRNSSVHRRKGGLAGSIQTAGFEDEDLKDIPIIVNGQIRTKTRSDGSFFIPGVDKGHHVIEIDEEGLPIQYVPLKRTIVAEVAPGAVTGMTFETVAQYGAAGQVKDASGNPAVEVPLVVTAGGETVAQTQTDSFGYYRFDALPAGNYKITTAPGWTGTNGGRSFTVTDDYVFDLDFNLGRPVVLRTTLSTH